VTKLINTAESIDEDEDQHQQQVDDEEDDDDETVSEDVLFTVDTTSECGHDTTDDSDQSQPASPTSAAAAAPGRTAARKSLEFEGLYRLHAIHSTTSS